MAEPVRRFVAGLDLGQAADYSALTIVEHLGDTLICNHIQRWPLGTPYPAVVAEVRQRVDTLRALPAEVWLILDQTGVGRPVADLFTLARLPCPLATVTITGGETESHDGDSYRVPKRDLVGSVSVALQTGRLRIVRSLPEAATLLDELRGFRATITASGHDTYGNDAGGTDWRSAPHDDLVLALALAVWWASRPQRAMPVLAFAGAARRWR